MRTAKLFKGYYEHPDDGCMLAWFTKRAEAQEWVDTQKKDLKDQLDSSEEEGDPSGVTEYNIPLSRKGLIRWLNLHFNSDNG